MKRLLYLILCIIIIISCHKSNNPNISPPPAVFSISDTVIYLNGITAASDSFLIEANVKWSITIPSKDTSWLMISTVEGNSNIQIIVTAKQVNKDSTIRSSTLTIKTDAPGFHPFQIRIIQSPVLLTVDKFNLTEKAYSNIQDSFSIITRPDYSWIIQSKGNWYALDATSGTGSKTIHITTLSTNNSSSPNSGSITINPQGNSTIVLATISIVQSAMTSNQVISSVFGGTSAEVAHISSTTKNGFIIAGSTSSNDGDVFGNHGSNDGWILNLAISGGSFQKLWAKTYGGSGSDELYAIQTYALTGSPGYISVGTSTSNDGNVSGNHGGQDGWVVKLDDNGNIIWSKLFGGTGNDVLKAVWPSPSGGCLAVGSTTSNDGDISGNHGGTDAWIISLDANGNILWSKTYGGSADDSLTSIVFSDIGFMAAGTTNSTNGDIQNNHGGYDGLALAFDSGNGLIISCKVYGGSGDDGFNAVNSSKFGTDDGFLFAGYTLSNDGNISGNHGSSDAWVVKVDASYNLQLSNVFGGSAADAGNDIILNSSGNIVMFISSYSNDGDIHINHGDQDIGIFEISTTGNLLRNKIVGGSLADSASFLAYNGKDIYYLIGTTMSSDADYIGNHGSTDYSILQTQF